MTTPSSGPISAQDVANEFSIGHPIAFSVFYGKGGAPGSGAISLGAMRGRSNATTFNPVAGSYSAVDAGNYTITASSAVVWTWTVTGSTAGTGATVASGGTASSISLYPPNNAGTTNKTATYTVSAAGKTWTIASTTSGSGSTCVDISSFLPSGKLAGDVRVNDDMILLNREDDDGYHVEPVRAVSFYECLSVRIATASGINLVASVDTPITTYGGRVVNILDSLGIDVPVLDRGVFRWEPIVALEYVGVRRVAKISVDDGTYAAGEHDDGRYIFTHNVKQ